ncbi:hypothetical protein ACS5PU_06975 [Pedobacter sp. GSP4]|uniref:hypothetical protein n=1 Tax=Pedobacter sp. GSP4 TaxID=3453716 RepID=UPI003EEFBDE1
MEKHSNSEKVTQLVDHNLETARFKEKHATVDSATLQPFAADAEHLNYLVRCRNNFRNAIGISGHIAQYKRG